MMLYGKRYGGADPQLIEGDSFRMIISVPEFGKNPAKPPRIRKRAESGAESRAESGAESGAEKILSLIQDVPLSKSEIASKLELKTVTGSLNRSIKGLLFEGMIEYTIPGKPNSRLQKYRITPKGKAILENRHA
jgi:ATP-dependent DNA helicase RecG